MRRSPLGCISRELCGFCLVAQGFFRNKTRLTKDVKTTKGRPPHPPLRGPPSPLGKAYNLQFCVKIGEVFISDSSPLFIKVILKILQGAMLLSYVPHRSDEVRQGNTFHVKPVPWAVFRSRSIDRAPVRNKSRRPP